MKSRDDGLGNGKAAHQLVHAFDHLGGGFIGEGHGQDGFGHHAEILDQMSDAEGDDPRLAAACAGEDEHRAFSSLHGFTLLGIELIEK